MKKILFVLFLLIITSGCVDVKEVENVAKEATLEEIIQNPDFFWFMTYYNNFKVSQATVEEIKAAFVPAKHSFLIYVEPDCFCESDYDYMKFPAFIKILDSAEISSDYYQIFIVKNTYAKHPYSHIFTLSNLPTFIILKDGEFIFSVSDALLEYSFLHNPNKLAEFLLAGLKM